MRTSKSFDTKGQMHTSARIQTMFKKIGTSADIMNCRSVFRMPIPSAARQIRGA